ncbi:uncharacterized protein CEXT_635001 [Caerostris extrusa]|uniref:Uncharacterized protein n=1 Tax=Caerostris extrusa TaxID=172846 RepID=A0AAV4W254_CAEEX|nr:uncharacterized protein CEXT_635001 [Caerostris extrusa]
MRPIKPMVLKIPSTQSYTTDPPQYDNITESPEQNDTSKYVSENQQGYNYDKVQNEPYYTHDASADQTYQELPSESTDKQYSDTYYNEVDNPLMLQRLTSNIMWIIKILRMLTSRQRMLTKITIGVLSKIKTGLILDNRALNILQPQYADAYQDQPYGEYGDQSEYSTTQAYSQENYEYVSEGQQGAYGYPSESGHESYSNYSEPHSVEEQKSEIYYGDDKHERAAKSERFTSSPQHKGYSPQRSSKRRRQRQYSDPVTSSNAIPILSQTQVTSSGTITQATKELSSSATTVAEDTSTTAGGGILSVLSSKVSKGYKMMSMPTLTKKDTAPPTSATSTKSGSKSGSMTSIFNLGSTLDSFKIGSRTKSRSDSVKSDSELSVYDEPQADLVVDYPQEEVAPPPPIRDTYSLQQASVEEDHDVFTPRKSKKIIVCLRRNTMNREYNDETYYQEQDYQDNTGEYPADYYETQEVEEVEEDELPSSERTVTPFRRSGTRRGTLRTRPSPAPFPRSEPAQAPGGLGRVRDPDGKHVQRVCLFSCVSDSRQSSIAQSEYSSLGSMESVVPNDGAKQDGGSLESYGDRGQQDGSEEVSSQKKKKKK